MLVRDEFTTVKNRRGNPNNKFCILGILDKGFFCPYNHLHNGVYEEGFGGACVLFDSIYCTHFDIWQSSSRKATAELYYSEKIDDKYYKLCRKDEKNVKSNRN